MRKPEHSAACVQQTLERFQRLDILVNCAAGNFLVSLQAAAAALSVCQPGVTMSNSPKLVSLDLEDSSIMSCKRTRATLAHIYDIGKLGSSAPVHL